MLKIYYSKQFNIIFWKLLLIYVIFEIIMNCGTIIISGTVVNECHSTIILT
jgi:hypothetical protein